jgi:superoxide dismutase
MASKKKAAAKKGSKQKAVKLKSAAKRLLEENAGEITHLLFERMLKGSTTSGRLLIDIAKDNGSLEEAGEDQPKRSAALLLMAEPEWQEEADKPAAEPGA